MTKKDYIEKLEQENKELRKLVNHYKSLVINHNELKINTKFFWDSVLLLTTYKI
jgi:hypothetical protein